MSDSLSTLFGSKQYIPHGHCYLWQTPLVGLHLVSDLLIAIAYFSIPVMLLYFVWKRHDVPFQNVFVLFGAFIILCGVGHLLDIWTLWHPIYWVSGIEQAMTAMVSCYTAIEMAGLLPRFLSLKAPEQLERVNLELQREIVERQKAEAQLRQANEELELRVQKRTAELQQAAAREQAIARVIQRMRQTLDLETIFADTTEELRQAIACDRVLVYQFNSDWSGKLVSESVAAGWPSLVPQQDEAITDVAIEQPQCVLKIIKDSYLQESQGGIYSQRISYGAVADVYESDFDPCYLRLLEQLQAKAYLVVPIFCNNDLWGLLFAYQHSAPRQWDAAAIQIMIQVGTQLGVAVQQGELLAQTQKQAKELCIAKNAAEKASDSKSEFLANMSHELRTPLNAILGYAQLMRRSTTLSAEEQRYISAIDHSGEHLLSLINDVLEMSKIEAGQLSLYETSLDLYNLLTGLEDMLSLRAQIKQLQLVFDCEANLPRYIKADQNKLRQVLINILGNAIKFTDRGQIKLQVWQEQQRLYFSVADTGPGISLEAKQKLFAVFSQAEAGLQSGEGTGLGLSISSTFVELMGGEITVSSTVGQGATFTFYIPYVAAESVTTKPTIPSRCPIALVPGQPECRILVAEDKSTNRDLLVKFLSSVGFAVQEASNGQEAVNLWQRWKPHLIWMDMQMPVMSGYEAIQQIKSAAAGEATVIIALTASVFEEQRQKILAIGCDDFVRKPFRQEEIFAKIKEHLGVQYLYAEASADYASVLSPDDLAIMPDQLQIMTPDWIAAVHQRASEGNDLLLLELVQHIPAEQTDLINGLNQLIDNFKFDEIVSLTQASLLKA